MTGLIAVGVDGSPNGRDALRFALAEARLRDAKLSVVYAWSAPHVALSDPCMTAAVEHELRELAAEAHALIGRELDAVGAPSADVEIEEDVVDGRPAAALIDAAAGADLLVVGSRGHGSLVGSLLGSVSQQCLQHAPCPVAVVRSASTGERRRVVVGVDGSVGSEAALAWALDAARRRETSVHAVCAYKQPSGLTTGGFTNAGLLPMLRDSLARSAERILDAAEQWSTSDVAVSTASVCGPAADSLLAAAADSDLLVVGSRGRGGFESLLLGSVSQRCAARTDRVVVVVPSPGPARPA
jgi:nucleotide-binding universal stress UspA family protein